MNCAWPFGLGSDSLFETFGPSPFDLGGAPAVAYGFIGTMSDGSSSELQHQYATIVGDDVVLVGAAAYDDGGCPGRDDTSTFDSATLAEARPHIERVLTASPLPQPH